MEKFYTKILDWKGDGYFTEFNLETCPDLANDDETELWLELQSLVDIAKKGHLEGIEEKLLNLFSRTETGILYYNIMDLMGDVGSSKYFKLMMEDIYETCNSTKSVYYGRAIFNWGNLSLVPFFLDQYDRNFYMDISGGYPLYFSRMFEDNWGPLSRILAVYEYDSFEEYEKLVLKSYEEFKTKLGTDDILILFGEVFNVVKVAKKMLRCLGDSHYENANRHFLRKIFEANTGIDCSSFYKNRIFQPQATKTIIGNFLNSPEAEKYEDNTRYFFGKKIE